ncbi:MAG: tetratricopeptide repeat protein [Acidobacteriota bacterium]
MFRFISLILSVFMLTPTLAGQNLRSAEFLKQARGGFDHIYNLDYDQAADSFSSLKRKFPEHPAPPIYLATVVWLSELLERQELDLDRFITPTYFTSPAQEPMDDSRRKAFFRYIEESQRLAEAVLKRDPENPDARYFLGSAHGLLGAFTITIDRSYRGAFGHGKKAYQHHLDLVEEDPEYYDAYMSVGLYEYIVDNLKWYIKWIAVLIGYRGSEERGFEYLQRAAERGQFVNDDARILQMVLFVREKRYKEALRIVEQMHKKYSRNYILHLNRAQILEKLGQKKRAARTYREVLEMAQSRRPNYHKLPGNFSEQIRNKLAELGEP